VTTNFRVGKGIGIVSDATIALFEPMNGALAEAMWTMLDAGAGIDELLEELSRAGLRSLGSFAMAQFEDSATRIVVRGSATARLNGPLGMRDLGANGVRTWVEEVVQNVVELDLTLGAYSAGPLPFRLSSGLVPADFLHRGEVTLPQLVGLSVDWVEEFRSEDIVVEPITPTPEKLTKRPSTTDEDPAHTRTMEDAGPLVTDETDPPAGADPVVSAIDGVDEYDAIYGRTVARSVQAAAVSIVLEPHEAAPVPPAPAQDSVGPESQAAAIGVYAERVSPPGSLIEAVPMIEGIPTAGGAVANLPLGDHDGRTMTKAQLKALRAAQGDVVVGAAPVSSMGGAMVQAQLCRMQHPNPPQLSSCRVCQAPLGSAPVFIARPNLGTLRFGEGTIVTLDRPALIGRNPRVEGAMPNEVPHLAKIDVGQGLSRTHAAVRLEGWQVLLEDLNSANGTVVRLPGREPRRLHPGEPIMLEPGSHIDFGGEVECTFEP